MSWESETFVSPGPPPAALALRILRPPSPGRRFALIAHPWGRLGGCKDEPVTRCLAHSLASQGWTVFIYDARGVGDSKGSASWT